MNLSKWKALIALLVATVALIGSAAAWDSTNYLQYQYTKYGGHTGRGTSGLVWSIIIKC